MTDPRLQSAVEHHTAGRLQQAEALYRQILLQQPDHPDALHLLGVLAYQVNRHAIADQLIRAAIAIKPGDATFHNHHGGVLLAMGRADDSVRALREAVRLDPRLAEAHSNLGNALKALGKMDEAITAYQTAISLSPELADAHSNLGVAYAATGRIEDALEAYQRATALNPGLAVAWQNLANALVQRDRADEAIVACRRAVELTPQSGDAHHRLGLLLARQFRLSEAVDSLSNAVRLSPDLVEAYNELGLALHKLANHAASIDVFREAIRRQPDYFAAHLNLANALKDLKRREEAIECLLAALKIRPDSADVYNNLGVVYYEMHRIAEAVSVYQRCLTLRPDAPEALNNLGNALMKQGRVEEAIESLRKSLCARSDYAGAHSNLLYALHLRDGVSLADLVEAHRCWNGAYAMPLAKEIKPHPNDRTPDRRLRVGLVSTDLRDHPVGRFLLPILEHRDTSAWDAICYSGVIAHDSISQRIHAACNLWRSVSGMSDQRLAGQIREDCIDILIDLSGHTAGNRLLVFARKPAPVQMSYLGYPDTTGLGTIDYRITDRLADPEGEADLHHSETLIRLDESLVCYQRFGEVADAGPPPVRSNGFVTFGSFNNWAKVSPRAMRTWARLLDAVPGSRLLIKAISLNDEPTRELARSALEANGLPMERVELLAPLGTYEQHLSAFRRADIALDTFPYAGTTTTCEALDMGVPVVTLVGERHAGRMGASILASAGLKEWIAGDEDEYIAIATRLAGHVDKLCELRTTLPDTLARSALCDADRLTRGLEKAFRDAWKRWCESQAPLSAGELVDRGNTLHQQGNLTDAESFYRRAIATDPNNAAAYSNLGVALASQEKPHQAIDAYRKALSLNPDVPQTMSNLANTLAQVGESEQALALLRRAIELAPRVAIYHVNLGNALLGLSRREEAIQAFGAGVACDPNDTDALNNLATALADDFRAGEALEAIDRCLTIRPDFAPALANRGNALLAQGRITEAIEAYQRSVALDPGNARTMSNVLYAMHLREDWSPREVFEAHENWSRRYASKAGGAIQPHENDRSPQRKLRIGYVSADLRDHPVGRFLLPILEARDRDRFEIVCYAGVLNRDAVGERIATASDTWRSVATMSDDALASQVRADAIDLLVDLSGHTAAHRLLVFARKPAPVQVSYLGYPDTTGLTAIDWRLTDRFADPVGRGDEFHTEKLWRLDRSLVCYRPPDALPPIDDPPASRNGFVTFGSFNNWAKISPGAMRTWARLLQAVPNSRLLIKSLVMTDDATRDLARQALADAGVPVDRVDLHRPARSHTDHLAAYRLADIALDSFPYTGTTTTCESLIMGVPVVALAGQTHASRMGASILSATGLEEWIARDEDACVSIAAALTSDGSRMKPAGESLRAKVLASPLCDATHAARAIEHAFRQMWRKWCARA